MTRRIGQTLKTYFYFNRSERKGILFLLFLLVGVIIFPEIYKQLFPPPPFNFSVVDIGIDLPHLTDSARKGQKEDRGMKLFPFDPNAADEHVWRKLGLKEREIKTIMHFRKAGGRFTLPSDLHKIYGISPKVIGALIPFVKINPVKGKGLPADTASKRFTSSPVELNTADSVSLVALYRIGPAMAHRILEYRRSLGGFLNLEQLKEIWGFDEDILFDLRNKIYVDPGKAKQFNLNEVNEEELRVHPYFKYKLSRAIINYRMQHGSYKEMEDLKKIVIINDSVYKRIRAYLYLP